MGIADKIRLLSPHYVEREIGDRTYRFYPCSVRLVSRMSSLVAKVAGHLAVLLGGGKQDGARTFKQWSHPETGEMVDETHVSAINPELARLRAEQRQKSIEGALEELMHERYRLAFGEMLINSLRDEFPRGEKRSSQDIQDFVDEMDVVTFVEYLRGLAAANAKVFGDLGNRLAQAARQRADELLGEDAAPDAQKTDG